MQDGEHSKTTQSPDLLRRFIPTPVKARYRLGRVHVIVQTNDLTLLPAFSLQLDPVDIDSARADEQSLQWTLVRDADAHGRLEPPMFLRSEILTAVMMGSACLVGVDHERRELLGFIGADVDPRSHHDFLVPLLCQITNEVFVSTRSSRIAVWSREFDDR